MKPAEISDKNYERLKQRALLEGIAVDELLDRFLDTKPASEDAVPYKTLLEHTTDSISLFDPELRYVYVNPILTKLTGFSRAEMIGKSDRELGMPEENLQFWRAAWDEVIETGQEKIITFDFQTSQGDGTYESRLTPIYDNNAELIYLLSITRDVTERKQAQEMLKDITNHLPGMIMRYELFPDGQETVSYVSEGVNTIYEIPVEEALTDINKLWAKVHPADLADFARSIEESAKDLTFWEYEWRIHMKDGSVKWVAGLGTPHRKEDGTTVWNTLLLDITESKHLKEQQEALLEQLELAIDTAQLGFWSLNLKTDELYWNDQLFEIYGLTREEFVPVYDSWRQQVHPDDLDEAETRLQEITTKGKIFNVAFRIIRKSDGEIRYINASANTLGDQQNQPKMLIGINIDVTERKHAEQAKLEHERLIANLNIEKERISTFQRVVAKLEHDIRTPLSIISTSREILSKYSERIDEDQRRERLETIGKQLSYVTQLLNDLTMIHHISGDERELNLAPKNLKKLCQITVQDIQETIGKKHHLYFDPDFEHDLVLIDDVLVSRILLNLLSNAVKYSPAGSEIRLVLRAHTGRIILKIIDQGLGIEAHELKKIFTPFYRIKTVEDHVEGNGLGLSIVKDCIEKHNGKIRVESKPGQGTTFTVELTLILPK